MMRGFFISTISAMSGIITAASSMYFSSVPTNQPAIIPQSLLLFFSVQYVSRGILLSQIPLPS